MRIFHFKKGLCGKSRSLSIKLVLVWDKMQMSWTRKYRQNGMEIHKTLLNEKRNILQFQFSYFVSKLLLAS